MALGIPRYFLLRSGSQYVVAQALVVVEKHDVVDAVGQEIVAKFEGPHRFPPIDAVELPAPQRDPCGDEDERAQVMMAAMGVMKNPGGGG